MEELFERFPDMKPIDQPPSFFDFIQVRQWIGKPWKSRTMCCSQPPLRMSAVIRFAHERRDLGTPVERLVPEVKGLVREATACEGWCDPTDTLMAQVVRWAIAAYYDDPALAHVPRFY